MKPRPYVIVGWSGALLGIVRGVMLLTQPLYTTASSVLPSPGEPSSGTETVSGGLDGVTVGLGLVLVALVFGGVLVLLILGKRVQFNVLSLSLLFFSLVSLPSIGWVFLPATGLLALAAILSLLPGMKSRVDIPLHQ